MKSLVLSALVALFTACAPQPSSVPIGPPMCIVDDGDVIREIPCPTVTLPLAKEND